MASEDIREIVKQRYGQAAKAVQRGAKPSCCGGGASCGPSPDARALEGTDPITRDLYSDDEAALVPADALAASFGCGNPTALAELRAGRDRARSRLGRRHRRAALGAGASARPARRTAST